jgi:hypothetical protein
MYVKSIILFIYAFYAFIELNLYDNIKIQILDKKHTELVLAVYNEDISWVSDVINNYKKITIYSKNNERFNKLRIYENDKIKLIDFPNIGSCDHVYLYHIINNYHNLEDIIAFQKGTKYTKKQRYFNLNSYILLLLVYFVNNNKLKTFSLSFWSFSNNRNLNFSYFRSKYSNLGEYLESLFDKSHSAKLFKYSRYVHYGGNFIVSRKNIQRYDKKIYEKLIDNELRHPSREMIYFHERIWGLLFSNIKKNVFK